MWTLSQASSPAASVPLFRSAGSPIALATLAIGAATKPDFVQNWQPISIPVVPIVNGSIVTVPLPPNWQYVGSIIVGGQVLVEAENPNTPQSGEFVVDRDTNTIVLYPVSPITPGVAVTINGAIEIVPTDYVPASLVSILHGLPVHGEISWDESLEQHPSGSLNLVATTVQAAQGLRDRFKKNTEFTLFGIGFAVENNTEKINEDLLREFTIALNGKWSQKHYNRPSFLRGSAMTGRPIGGTGPDSDCQDLEPDGGVARIGSGGISIAALAAQVGVPFRAPGTTTTTSSRISSWRVDVPKDTPAEATANWSQEAQGLARQNGCFLDYSNPNAVFARLVSDGRVWRYNLSEAQIAYQGDTINSPDYRGYAIEYDNWHLSGPFDFEDDEPIDLNNPPPPAWQPREPQRITLESGDEDWETPPHNTTHLKTMSLNWDTSGPTKTLRRVTTEDGQPVEDEEFIYGFCYSAWQIVNADGELKGVPGAHWKQVQYKRREYLYDETYGFAVGYNTTGWRLGRFKAETDEDLATLSYGDGDSQYRALYTFRQLPIFERSQMALFPYSQFYKDSEEQPGYVAWKRCNRDGSASVLWIPDPTWAPAMFVKEELTYTSSFASTPNPDSGNDPESKLCPYTTGEESTVRVVRDIYPSKNTKSGIGGTGDFSFGADFDFERNGELEFDRYIERRFEDSAQGPCFTDKAVRETFTEYDGRPSPATRKPPLREPREPENDDSNNKKGDDTRQYEWYVCTPGWTVTDASGGSLSFEADTVSQAFGAAKTDLLIRDLQDSIPYSFAIPFNHKINMLDRMTLEIQGELHPVRVVGASHSVVIDNLEGEILLTGNASEISAGFDRTIPVTLHRRSPRSDDPDDPIRPPRPPGDGTPPSRFARQLVLADLGIDTLVTRRNF